MIVAKYSVYCASSTGNYHWDAWLVEGGTRIDSDSGCSIGPPVLGWQQAACHRQARRACRRMLRRHRRAQASDTEVEYFKVES